MKWLILFCAFSVSAQVARMPLPIVSSKRSAAASGPTVVATDSYDRADNSTLGANWTATETMPYIFSNQCIGNGGNAFYSAFWNANAFADNQYSKTIVRAVATGTRYVYVTARASGAGATYNGYEVWTDGTTGAGHSFIYRRINGAFLEIKALAITFTAGDVIEIRCSGTTISAYKNSTLVDSVTDATHASGSAGVGCYNTANVDDWEGGNL